MISIKAIFQEQEKIRHGIMISRKEKQEPTWDHILSISQSHVIFIASLLQTYKT